MLAAQWEHEENNWRPNVNQQATAARVADILEDCCDEYYDAWQDGKVTGQYWERVSERLINRNKWWSHFKPTATQVYKIAMTYIAHWDPKGRGYVAEDDMWGFQLGELTWGDRRAEIDPDLFAKPWVCFRVSLPLPESIHSQSWSHRD